MNTRRTGICLAVALVIIFPSAVKAEPLGGKINFGNLAIIPGIGVDGIYDDNIYKGNGKTYAPTSTISTTAAERKESDVVSHVRPSLFVNYIMPLRGLIMLGYRGDFAFYNTNNNNNWKSNYGSLDVNYTAPGGLLIGVKELYSKLENPFGSADQYAIGRVVKRYTNDLQTKVGYGLTRNFRTILYYNNYVQKYDSDLDFSQNYTINEAGASLDLQVLPKTWGFVRYLYGKQRYDSNPGGTESLNNDAIRHRASIGLNWDEGAKFTGEVSIGYESMKFENQLTPTGTTRDDRSTWGAATLVNYQATATTSLGLSLARTIRTVASNTNEYFVDTTVGLNARQQLLRKLAFTVAASYGKNDYNVAPVGTAVGGDPRSDTNYMANLGFYYDIQDWLGVGVSYNYYRKDSNYEANEFVNNQVMATVKVVY